MHCAGREGRVRSAVPSPGITECTEMEVCFQGVDVALYSTYMKYERDECLFNE
jgi:hypothetical protein